MATYVISIESSDGSLKIPLLTTSVQSNAQALTSSLVGLVSGESVRVVCSITDQPTPPTTPPTTPPVRRG